MCLAVSTRRSHSATTSISARAARAISVCINWRNVCSTPHPAPHPSFASMTTGERSVEYRDHIEDMGKSHLPPSQRLRGDRAWTSASAEPLTPVPGRGNYTHMGGTTTLKLESSVDEASTAEDGGDDVCEMRVARARRRLLSLAQCCRQGHARRCQRSRVCRLQRGAFRHRVRRRRVLGRARSRLWTALLLMSRPRCLQHGRTTC